jgi:error-prone DNA polymerase
MVESLADGAQVEVAGLVVCRQRPGTAKGFVFMVLEDEYGLVNVIVKPNLYERARNIVRTEPFLVIKGELQRRDGITNLIAREAVPFRVGDLAPVSHDFGHGGHGGRH